MVLSKRGWKITNNGPFVEMYLLEITDENRHRGGEIIGEISMPHDEAVSVAKHLISCAVEAKKYELNAENWNGITFVDRRKEVRCKECKQNEEQKRQKRGKDMSDKQRAEDYADRLAQAVRDLRAARIARTNAEQERDEANERVSIVQKQRADLLAACKIALNSENTFYDVEKTLREAIARDEGRDTA
jgi:hypothetical protein